MGNFFNPDNAFFKTMGKIWDMMVISFIWFITSIPVYFAGLALLTKMSDLVSIFLFLLIDALCMVLIGPSTTAMYYFVVKVIRRERGYALREFFRSFKLNFKQGAVIGAVFGVLATLLSFDFQYSYALSLNGDKMGTVLMVVSFFILFALLGIMVNIFPLLSRFTMSVKSLFKTALFMTFRHLPTTVLLVVIVAASAVIVYLAIPLVFIVPAGCALLCSFLMEKVLKKYMPKPENIVEADGDHVAEGHVVSENEEGKKSDLWYLE